MNTRRSIGRLSAVGVTLTATVTVLAATGGTAFAAGTATTKYVSCNNGSDSNSGSQSAPFRTVRKATSRAWPAGTTILLARGCAWDGAVTLSGDGTSSSPITIGAYGQGDAPLLTGKSINPKDAILHLTGQYQVVENIHLSQARNGYGVTVDGAHDGLDSVEIDRVGTGANFNGAGSWAYKARVHDLTMMVNTPGGDDDFGAVGFNVHATDIDISYSDCTNCTASSYDYGTDGGFVEVWEYGDRLNVHDNTGTNINGILEIGGFADDSSARDLKIDNNTFKQTTGGFYFHDSTRFSMPVDNVEVAGNKLFGKSADDPEMFGGNISTLRFNRNIVKTPGQVTWSGEPESHKCNVYSLSSSDKVGYDLNSSERLVTNGSTPTSLPSGC